MKLLHVNGPMPYYTNTFLVIDNGKAAVVDPAADPQDYLLLLQKENAKLEYILLTHGHHDHVAAVAPLKGATGAKFIMHEADAKQFEMSPDGFYEDGKEIAVGNVSIKPIFTPGHTQGSVCLLCNDVMFSGDTLFFNDVGRTDLEGGNLNQLRQSLIRLKNEVPDNVQVLPGHEDFTTMKNEKQKNPYMNGRM